MTIASCKKFLECTDMEMKWAERKVVIVGAGAVGSSFAYALAQSGDAEEIVLLDRNQELAAGQALDLAHGQPYYPSVNIRAGDDTDYATASAIVVTAGAKQQPGESRMDLLHRNARIVGDIAQRIADSGSSAVVICVTNPVDVMTAVMRKRCDWPSERVIGSGTVLDSARFRYLLARHCGINIHSVHAYILGEHGDSEFAAWSMTNVAGMPMEDYCPACRGCENWQATREGIVNEVRRSAYHIIGYKGATDFGIGMALVQIVRAILRNEHRVMTVSTWLDGEFGLHELCLGLPCMLGRQGVERVLRPHLTATEREALQASAAVIKKATDAVLAS